MNKDSNSILYDNVFGPFVKCENNTYEGTIFFEGNHVRVLLFFNVETIYTLHAIYSNMNLMIHESKTCAVNMLIDVVNEELKNERKPPVSKKALLNRMKLDSILLTPYYYTFAFSKEDILPDNFIRATYTLEEDLTSVELDCIEVVEIIKK